MTVMMNIRSVKLMESRLYISKAEFWIIELCYTTKIVRGPITKINLTDCRYDVF